MIEQIEAYKNLRKADKFLKGAIKLADMTGDNDLATSARLTLYLNRVARTKVLFSKKKAREYNLKAIEIGMV